ncbi:MAG: hypothetical protein WDN47_02910 [Candidatus Doudnabacteria bacterium]
MEKIFFGWTHRNSTGKTICFTIMLDEADITRVAEMVAQKPESGFVNLRAQIQIEPVEKQTGKNAEMDEMLVGGS